MAWELWVVIGVSIVALIIWSLVRASSGGGNDGQDGMRAGPAAGQRDRPALAERPRRPAQSAGDLDRFLREVQRRKQGAAPRPTPPAARPAPPAVRPVEQRRPLAPPPRPQPAPRPAARPAP